MKVKKQKNFANGTVYCLQLEDGRLIETTDTFLPYYTKDAIGRKQNILNNKELGDRSERWMIGVSVMSGCPVGCKFCATGQMKGWRNLIRKMYQTTLHFHCVINAGRTTWVMIYSHLNNL